ncbi:MAG: imidazole glycerol phosphate synthase subunit HisH [Desulfuromonadia bacterium]
MIAIIDYGMGNLRSVQKGFERLGFDAVVTTDPAMLDRAERIVLPGVGAFRDCMTNLERGGFVEPIYRVIQKGKPFLGICVGLQLLFDESDEFGIHRGLGIIPGKVVRFPVGMILERERLPVPHMGWNQLSLRTPSPLFRGIDDGVNVYFVHSYYAIPRDPSVVAAVAEYGVEFCASVISGNVVGTQFHPEKSQSVGLSILKNFGEMT